MGFTWTVDPRGTKRQDRRRKWMHREGSRRGPNVDPRRGLRPSHEEGRKGEVRVKIIRHFQNWWKEMSPQLGSTSQTKQEEMSGDPHLICNKTAEHEGQRKGLQAGQRGRTDHLQRQDDSQFLNSNNEHRSSERERSLAWPVPRSRKKRIPATREAWTLPTISNSRVFVTLCAQHSQKTRSPPAKPEPWNNLSRWEVLKQV